MLRNQLAADTSQPVRGDMAATTDSDLPQQLTTRIGGTLSFEQHDQEGTRIVLTLPLEQQVEAEQTEKKTKAPENTLAETETAKNDGHDFDERLLAMAIQVINERMYDPDFNVTALRQELGIGDKMLYRKLKQLTGLTPVEFLRTSRLKRAASLLKEGKFSVTEVMNMVGFTRPSYFSKCFFNEFGVTPGNYM